MSQRHFVLLLLAITAVVHALALDGAFVYDDELLIVQNGPLQRGEVWTLLSQPYFGQEHGYWRPLTSLGLWLGNAAQGAAGIHALALVAHLVATLFAFRLARHWLASDPVAPDRWAFAAALLFGLHPVHVEGTAWCSALNDPLWLACGLGCLDAVLRSRPLGAALWFAFALLAKENALVLLPAALSMQWLLGGPATAQSPLTNAPQRPWAMPAALTAVALAWFALRMVVFGDVLGGLGLAPVDPVVAAHRATATATSFGRHLGLLVWPWPMSPFRALAATDGQSIQGIAGGLAWAFAWLLGLATALLRGRRNVAFALLLLALAPLLAALRCDRLGAYPVADRYLGPSVLGFALLWAMLLPLQLRAAVPCMLATIAAGATLRQIPVWKNQLSLLEHALHAEPQDPALQVMAGRLWLAMQQETRARAYYQQALNLVPAASHGVAHKSAVDARVGLGWCALNRQPPDAAEARANFEAAIQQDSQTADAWIGLGVAHGMAGRGADAERALRQAIQLVPNNSSAHFNLAFLYEKQGRTDLARAACAEALRLDPNNGNARALLDRLR